MAVKFLSHIKAIDFFLTTDASVSTPADRIGNCSGRVRLSESAKANLKMSAPEAKNQPPPRKGAYTKHITALHKDQFIRVQVR